MGPATNKILFTGQWMERWCGEPVSIALTTTTTTTTTT
jgi:hypothetical protein